MDQPTKDVLELAPLDQIRRAEAETARRVATANAAAQVALSKAQAQAEEIKRQSRETGLDEGRAEYREMIAAAEEEAQEIIAQARRQADRTRQRGKLCMEMAVSYAVGLVIGQEIEVENTWS